MADTEPTIDVTRAKRGRPDLPGAYVAVVSGGRPQVVELQQGVEVSIGRSRSSGIMIEDPAVSRLQATVLWDGATTVILRDHGSRNPTKVTGKDVVGRVTLPSGSEFKVGSVVLVVAVTGMRPRADQPTIVATGPRCQWTANLIAVWTAKVIA